ncbi:hypothetical protein FDF74_03420 [Clostridium niameyense]|uniref:Type I restriction modification DNA specificity domain-containing protein n=1 Tax=Clostridium niameyense TaxID=1622073 RepID=A0A6M0R7Q1_9CLOT|nr:restriction endonuclease subunit S [Clostridium niameyense]NEZ46261.1 hypothetical protein [Clostridium niameyense]
MSLVRIKDICKINPQKEKATGKVSFIKMEDVSIDGRILNKEEKNYEDVSTGFSAFKDKDVLVAKITPCFENGKGAYVDGLLNGVGFGSTEFHVVRADERKILSKYLFYHLNCKTFRKYGEINMTGSAGQKRVPKDFIEKYKIFLPSMTEQEKIVEILSTWDLAIEKQEQLIEKKKEFKKGLMQRLLSGEFRFKEFKDKWKTIKLGEAFKERKETGFIDLELLAITTANGVVRRTEVDVKDTSSEDKSKYKRILPGDIGYNTMRMWQGVSGLSKYEGIVSPAYTILKPMDNINSLYMSYLFKVPKIINLFYRHSQGLVSDTLNLKYENFKGIKVCIPNSIEEQKKIADVFVNCDKEIELLEKELEALKLQKKGLMQRLLTGELRVKV